MLRWLPFVAKAFAIAALISVPVGCSKTPPPKAGGCDTDQDCIGSDNGGFCVAGDCQACRDSADCGEGQICSLGRCEADPTATNDDAEEPTKEPPGGIRASSSVPPIPPRCLNASGRLDLPPVTFDYDDYALLPEVRSALQENAPCLDGQIRLAVILEGHCDERGTQEYNLALGEKRANAVLQYLNDLGVSGVKLRTLSKGKNEPICVGSKEACHAKNRRVEFVLQ